MRVKTPWASFPYTWLFSLSRQVGRAKDTQRGPTVSRCKQGRSLIAPRSSLYTLIETVRITKATYLICQIKVTTSTTTDPSVQWDRCFLDRQHSFATCWNSDISLHKIKTPQERTDGIDLCQIVAMLCTIFIQEKLYFQAPRLKTWHLYFGGPQSDPLFNESHAKIGLFHMTC